MSIVSVAKAAGVSQATVSRVINKHPGVSDELVKAVRDAMQALGYEPPPLKRRPGRRVPKPDDKKAAGGIGVLLLDQWYQYAPGLCLACLRGIDREAADHHLPMIVSHAWNAEHLALPSSRIVGLILIGSRVGPRLLKQIRQYPHVWMTSHHDPAGDIALGGNHEIAKLAFDYLVKRKHEHLGFLAVTSSYPAHPARAQAFQFLASTRGLTADIFMDDDIDSPDDLPDWDGLVQRMELLVDRYMKASPRPTGMFIGDDAMAAMFYKAARARGIEPGKDVDVISCNNDSPALLGLDPRPATIDLGAEIRGRRSVEQLLRKIKHPEETRQVRIAISPVLIEPR